MMRVLFGVTILLLPTTCGAQTILQVADISNFHPGDFSAATFADGVVSIGPQTWTIPNLTQADVGHTFTLNELNASDFGFDWHAASDYFFNNTSSLFGVSISGGTRIESHTYGGLSSFHDNRQLLLDHATFQLDSWISAIGITSRTMVFAAIPEPNSLALCALGSFALFRFSGRRQR
jgi:hypothetical protein